MECCLCLDNNDQQTMIRSKCCKYKNNFHAQCFDDFINFNSSKFGVSTKYPFNISCPYCCQNLSVEHKGFDEYGKGRKSDNRLSNFQIILLSTLNTITTYVFIYLYMNTKSMNGFIANIKPQEKSDMNTIAALSLIYGLNSGYFNYTEEWIKDVFYCTITIMGANILLPYGFKYFDSTNMIYCIYLLLHIYYLPAFLLSVCDMCNFFCNYFTTIDGVKHREFKLLSMILNLSLTFISFAVLIDTMDIYIDDENLQIFGNTIFVKITVLYFITKFLQHFYEPRIHYRLLDTNWYKLITIAAIGFVTLYLKHRLIDKHNYIPIVVMSMSFNLYDDVCTRYSYYLEQNRYYCSYDKSYFLPANYHYSLDYKTKEDREREEEQRKQEALAIQKAKQDAKRKSIMIAENKKATEFKKQKEMKKKKRKNRFYNLRNRK